jgi:hypothetical protein
MSKAIELEQRLCLPLDRSRGYKLTTNALKQCGEGGGSLRALEAGGAENGVSGMLAMYERLPKKKPLVAGGL